MPFFWVSVAGLLALSTVVVIYQLFKGLGGPKKALTGESKSWFVFGTLDPLTGAPAVPVPAISKQESALIADLSDFLSDSDSQK